MQPGLAVEEVISSRLYGAEIVKVDHEQLERSSGFWRSCFNVGDGLLAFAIRSCYKPNLRIGGVQDLSKLAAYATSRSGDQEDLTVVSVQYSSATASSPTFPD